MSDGTTLSPTSRVPRHRLVDVRRGDPATDAYGYVMRGRARASTRERMAAMFAASEQVEAIERVWTPETGGLVDPWQVPWIVEAHARRLRRGVARNVVIVLLGLLAAPGLLWLALRLPETRGLVFAVALGATPWVFAASVELFRLANPRRASRDLLAAPALGRALATWTGRPFRRSSLALVVGWAVVMGVGLVARGHAGAIEALALAKTGPAAHEAWRWATATTMHDGVLHLWFNATSMLVLGAATEALAGRAALGLVFAVAALAGSAASVALLHHGASVGASGGIVGLLGFLVVHGARFHDRLPPGFARRFGANVVFLSVFSLALLPYLDHAAHAGGLVAGALVGLVVPPRHAATPAPRWLACAGAWGWAAVAASLVTSLAVLLFG